MNDGATLAKDKLGKCRYVIRVTGTTLRCTMRGYGLEATETQEITRKGDEFNYDAAELTKKMVTLERRMRDLARLTTALKANNVTGIAKVSPSQACRPARNINPLSKIKV